MGGGAGGEEGGMGEEGGGFNLTHISVPTQELGPHRGRRRAPPLSTRVQGPSQGSGQERSQILETEMGPRVTRGMSGPWDCPLPL